MTDYVPAEQMPADMADGGDAEDSGMGDGGGFDFEEKEKINQCRLLVLKKKY